MEEGEIGRGSYTYIFSPLFFLGVVQKVNQAQSHLLAGPTPELSIPVTELNGRGQQGSHWEPNGGHCFRAH